MGSAERTPYVVMARIVVEDLIEDSLERMIVHDRQNAEGPIVHFIGGDVAGEVGQGLIQILTGDVGGRPFSPPASTQF